MPYSQSQKTVLLNIARLTINSRLTQTERPRVAGEDDPALLEKRACFVTLHLRGRLRGCIGSILPHQTLLESVEENAVNAAFRDPRFKPLTADELSAVAIEISVLTVPTDLPHVDADKRLSALRPQTDGVILRRGQRSATFLPQVWEQLPNAEDFLGHLCVKGGMEKDCWKDPDTVVQVYQVEYFSE